MKIDIQQILNSLSRNNLWLKMIAIIAVTVIVIGIFVPKITIRTKNGAVIEKDSVLKLNQIKK